MTETFAFELERGAVIWDDQILKTRALLLRWFKWVIGVQMYNMRFKTRSWAGETVFWCFHTKKLHRPQTNNLSDYCSGVNTEIFNFQCNGAFQWMNNEWRMDDVLWSSLIGQLKCFVPEVGWSAGKKKRNQDQWNNLTANLLESWMFLKKKAIAIPIFRHESWIKCSKIWISLAREQKTQTLDENNATFNTR